MEYAVGLKSGRFYRGEVISDQHKFIFVETELNLDSGYKIAYIFHANGSLLFIHNQIIFRF